MQIELSERAADESTKRATASGVDVRDSMDTLLFGETSQLERKKPYTAEELKTMLEKGGGSLGRNGRPWRDFIHEGHTY